MIGLPKNVRRIEDIIRENPSLKSYAKFINRKRFQEVGFVVFSQPQTHKDITIYGLWLLDKTSIKKNLFGYTKSSNEIVQDFIAYNRRTNEITYYSGGSKANKGEHQSISSFCAMFGKGVDGTWSQYGCTSSRNTTDHRYVDENDKALPHEKWIRELLANRSRTMRKTYLSQHRYQVSQRTRYKVFLDQDRYLPYISKIVQISEEALRKRDGLDRALIAKLAHWNESHIEKMRSLPEKYSNLKSQFLPIVCLTAVEASIGMPKGETTARITEFYENNLDAQDKKSLIESFSFINRNNARVHKQLKDVIDQLIERRNGLLHRGELINLLSDDEISFMVTRGHTVGKNRRYRGRIGSVMDISLTADAFTDITKRAINNYFQKEWPERRPVQDFTLVNRKYK